MTLQSAVPFPETEAHVWWASTDVLPTAIAASYRRLLSNEERVHLNNLPLEEGRREYLVARGLVRMVLSLYEPVPATAWRFRRDAYGRPSISGPLTALPLDFNISHARGVAVCIVGVARRVGVDVEQLDHRVDVMEVAPHALTPSEKADLAAIPAGSRRRRFLEYWTCKESYTKAHGQGLSIPLNLLSLVWRDTGPQVLFTPFEEDPSIWSFHSFTPTSKHVATAAVERRFRDEAVRLVVRPIQPLLALSSVQQDRAQG
jgi:4'-phosphopantetheinyl transferase